MKVGIYCPRTTNWTPESLKTGLGGSETAVVEMAKELSLLGHEVLVGNGVNSPKEFGGVTYMPHSWFPAELDVLIVWRYASSIKDDLKHVTAHKKLLWLHDMVPEAEVLPYMYLYDQILVLSSFHRKYYPNIPDTQITITRNGITLLPTSVERKPFQLVYASNYDRGLLALLENWTRIKIGFPEATLHIAYGYETLDFLAEQKGGDHLEEWEVFKEYLSHLYDQDGVTHHGKLGKKELANLYASSAVLAYPCIYPEVSCIAAMEAQGYGAVPVVVPTAALAETVQYGFKTNYPATQDQYVELLISVLEDQAGLEDMRVKAMEFGKTLSWTGVAKSWHDTLFK